jgi:hypothetical protein
MIVEAGTWNRNNTTVTDVTACNYSTLASLGADVSTFVPETFEIQTPTETGFDLMIGSGSIACSILNQQFSCPVIADQADLNPTYDAILAINFFISGTIQSDSEMDIDIDIELASCSGSDCSILSFLIPTPCTIPTESSATFVP